MELKISDIISERLDNLNDSLVKLSKADLSIKSSYQVSKLVKKLYEELTLFGENKNKLIQKYGESSDGQVWKVKEENIKAFETELIELLNVVFNVDFAPITLVSNEDLKLSSIDILRLDKFIICE